jgi:hypothetical protein
MSSRFPLSRSPLAMVTPPQTPIGGGAQSGQASTPLGTPTAPADRASASGARSSPAAAEPPYAPLRRVATLPATLVDAGGASAVVHQPWAAQFSAGLPAMNEALRPHILVLAESPSPQRAEEPSEEKPSLKPKESAAIEQTWLHLSEDSWAKVDAAIDLFSQQSSTPDVASSAKPGGASNHPVPDQK